MSLDRKIGQMTQAERLSVTPAEVREHHLGSVLSGGGSTPGANRPADWVAMADELWEASAAGGPEQGAVPVLYGVDAVHGNSNVLGATVFPHNIGLGAAGDPELMERIARITARETLACGVDWVFAPTLAVARDDRWGRTYESYSEDPGIVASYAGRFVGALQADLGPDGVVACAKHWVGDGATTHGIDQGDAAIPRAELESLHVAPYRPAIEAGVLTVMASYSSWNGDKCHGHRYLLTDLLKGQLGFRGFVVSDWNGLDQLDDDFGEAVALGVNAGIDMAMVPESWREFMARLKEHVERGRVPLGRIDDAVRRILTVKQACGLLDRPRPSERPGAGDPAFGSAAHRETAREAVRKSLVLLKNEGGLLPLDRGARILVAGKNAHDRGHQCGGWTVEWQGLTGNDRVEGGTSIWEGIARLAPNATLSAGGTGTEADPRRHDAAIAVIGERPYAEGMGDVRRGDEVVGRAGLADPGDLPGPGGLRRRAEPVAPAPGGPGHDPDHRRPRRARGRRPGLGPAPVHRSRAAGQRRLRRRLAARVGGAGGGRRALRGPRLPGPPLLLVAAGARAEPEPRRLALRSAVPLRLRPVLYRIAIAAGSPGGGTGSAAPRPAGSCGGRRRRKASTGRGGRDLTARRPA